MSDIRLDCMCGNPECKEAVHLRKGAVFYDGANEAEHWAQGYIAIYGFDGKGYPEVMLDPAKMIILRDWLNEMYPEDAPREQKPEAKSKGKHTTWAKTPI